ncbi:hypothetical protein D3C85_1537950 [compost metagenome]
MARNVDLAAIALFRADIQRTRDQCGGPAQPDHAGLVVHPAGADMARVVDHRLQQRVGGSRRQRYAATVGF